MSNTQKTGFHTVKMDHEYPIEPLEYMPCPLCSANDDYVLATTGFPNEIPVRNVICKGCGMIRVDPRMTRENYELFYKEDFFGYLNPFERPAYVEEIEHTRDENYMTPTKKKVLPHVLPYVKEGGKVLDVGAGLGQIIYLLQKEKHVTAIGLEPDPFSRKIAREKMGVELTDITVEEFLKTNTEMFDFIFMDQTFEHLLSPLETIQGLAKYLTPEGVMYIGVPGAYNPTIHMKLFYQIAHTYNYTPHTMRLFAEKADLKIIDITDAEVYPLIALMAHKEASYPEVKEERMSAGSDWMDVVARHRRKRFLNEVRGIVKNTLTLVGGRTFKNHVKSFIDRLIGYRY